MSMHPLCRDYFRAIGSDESDTRAVWVWLVQRYLPGSGMAMSLGRRQRQCGEHIRHPGLDGELCCIQSLFVYAYLLSDAWT